MNDDNELELLRKTALASLQKPNVKLVKETSDDDLSELRGAALRSLLISKLGKNGQPAPIDQNKENLKKSPLKADRLNKEKYENQKREVIPKKAPVVSRKEPSFLSRKAPTSPKKDKEADGRSSRYRRSNRSDSKQESRYSERKSTYSSRRDDRRPYGSSSSNSRRDTRSSNYRRYDEPKRTPELQKDNSSRRTERFGRRRTSSHSDSDEADDTAHVTSAIDADARKYASVSITQAKSPVGVLPKPNEESQPVKQARVFDVAPMLPTPKGITISVGEPVKPVAAVVSSNLPRREFPDTAFKGFQDTALKGFSADTAISEANWKSPTERNIFCASPIVELTQVPAAPLPIEIERRLFPTSKSPSSATVIETRTAVKVADGIVIDAKSVENLPFNNTSGAADISQCLNASALESALPVFQDNLAPQNFEATSRIEGNQTEKLTELDALSDGWTLSKSFNAEVRERKKENQATGGFSSGEYTLSKSLNAETRKNTEENQAAESLIFSTNKSMETDAPSKPDSSFDILSATKTKPKFLVPKDDSDIDELDEQLLDDSVENIPMPPLPHEHKPVSETMDPDLLQNILGRPGSVSTVPTPPMTLGSDNDENNADTEALPSKKVDDESRRDTVKDKPVQSSDNNTEFTVGKEKENSDKIQLNDEPIMLDLPRSPSPSIISISSSSPESSGLNRSLAREQKSPSYSPPHNFGARQRSDTSYLDTSLSQSKSVSPKAVPTKTKKSQKKTNVALDKTELVPAVTETVPDLHLQDIPLPQQPLKAQEKSSALKISSESSGAIQRKGLTKSPKSRQTQATGESKSTQQISQQKSEILVDISGSTKSKAPASVKAKRQTPVSSKVPLASDKVNVSGAIKSKDQINDALAVKPESAKLSEKKVATKKVRSSRSRKKRSPSESSSRSSSSGNSSSSSCSSSSSSCSTCRDRSSSTCSSSPVKERHKSNVAIKKASVKVGQNFRKKPSPNASDESSSSGEEESAPWRMSHTGKTGRKGAVQNTKTALSVRDRFARDYQAFGPALPGFVPPPPPPSYLSTSRTSSTAISSLDFTTSITPGGAKLRDKPKKLPKSYRTRVRSPAHSPVRKSSPSPVRRRRSPPARRQGRRTSLERFPVSRQQPPPPQQPTHPEPRIRRVRSPRRRKENRFAVNMMDFDSLPPTAFDSGIREDSDTDKENHTKKVSSCLATARGRHVGKGGVVRRPGKKKSEKKATKEQPPLRTFDELTPPSQQHAQPDPEIAEISLDEDSDTESVKILAQLKANINRVMPGAISDVDSPQQTSSVVIDNDDSAPSRPTSSPVAEEIIGLPLSLGDRFSRQQKFTGPSPDVLLSDGDADSGIVTPPASKKLKVTVSNEFIPSLTSSKSPLQQTARDVRSSEEILDSLLDLCVHKPSVLDRLGGETNADQTELSPIVQEMTTAPQNPSRMKKKRVVLDDKSPSKKPRTKATSSHSRNIISDDHDDSHFEKSRISLDERKQRLLAAKRQHGDRLPPPIVSRKSSGASAAATNRKVKLRR